MKNYLDEIYTVPEFKRDMAELPEQETGSRMIRRFAVRAMQPQSTGCSETGR